MWDFEQLVRPNVQAMTPYSSARGEYSGAARTLLDANENSFGSVGPTAGLHRYPDPNQTALKAALAVVKHVAPNQIFLSNGSDEAIDLLVRLVCVPGRDSVLCTPPTFGMYEVAAALNDVALERVPLDEDFQLSEAALQAIAASKARIAFLCTPNNPTGNALPPAAVERVLREFAGLVVVDEAYGDFSRHPSWLARLAEFPNLVVLQTFSKAWGLAGLRLGMAFAAPTVVAYLNRIKMPYNVSEHTQQAALAALAEGTRFDAVRAQLLAGRAWLEQRLPALPAVARVYPSDANFLLVAFRPDAGAVYAHLLQRGIVVRRPSPATLAGTLRLTVGTPAENEALVAALAELS